MAALRRKVNDPRLLALRRQLGVLIDNAALDAGLSQKRCADRAGISKACYVELVGGRADGRLSSYWLLLDAIGLEPVISFRPKSAAPATSVSA